MRVEQVCHKSEVKFGVSGDQGRGGQEFAAVETVGVVEDLFGAMEEVAGLEWRAGAGLWG